MNKQSCIASKNAGGFHQLWLVLVELVASGLVITIGLTYNIVIAVLIVCVPLYVLLKKVARQQTTSKRFIETKVPAVDATNKQPHAPQQNAQPTYARLTTSLLAS